MGCTSTSITARVKSKLLPGQKNRSLISLDDLFALAVVLYKMEWNFPLRLIKNSDSPNQIWTYLVKSNLPNWQNASSLFVRASAYRSYFLTCVVWQHSMFGRSRVNKEWSTDRHVLWLLPVPVNRMLESIFLCALIEINSMLLTTEE